MKTNNTKKALRISICLILILLMTPSLPAQVKLSEQDWVIPNLFSRSSRQKSYVLQGGVISGSFKYIYPYGMNDVISDEKTDRAWKTVTLENEYIRLCIAPEIGGKLYYATDKSNGYNFIYRNNVVKPSNIGMLGAWVSGGIEWCVLHHHRASTFLTVDYTTSENSDGSKTIWIGETEPGTG